MSERLNVEYLSLRLGEKWEAGKWTKKHWD